MKFKDALRKAGLRNPGRTTWCGVATDGTPVFTIWSNQVWQIEGRWFAWWDHNEDRVSTDAKVSRRGGAARARKFIRLAKDNVGTGKRCRVVILHPKAGGGVDSADYPHGKWAEAEFRAADLDALQFIAELFPLA